jgi:hypothetical protein
MNHAACIKKLATVIGTLLAFSPCAASASEACNAFYQAGHEMRVLQKQLHLDEGVTPSQQLLGNLVLYSAQANEKAQRCESDDIDGAVDVVNEDGLDLLSQAMANFYLQKFYGVTLSQTPTQTLNIAESLFTLVLHAQGATTDELTNAHTGLRGLAFARAKIGE